MCGKMKTEKELKEGTVLRTSFFFIFFHIIVTFNSGEVLQMGFLIVILNIFGRE